MTALFVPAPAQAASSDACASGFDAGNSWEFAWTIVPPRNCTGQMDGNDGADWYAVNVPPGSLSARLDVNVCPTSSWDPDVRLYFATSTQLLLVQGPGTLKASSVNGSGQCDRVSATLSTTDAAQGGRWYIHVYVFSGAGAYSMAVVS